MDNQSPRLLLVDDEPTTLEVMEMFLRNEGYRTFLKSQDARRVLALIREWRPDLALLNLRMPHVSGLELLRALQLDDSLRQIPVIIVTSSGDAETRQLALESGAADFLSKPIDPRELAQRVRSTLAARAYRDGCSSSLGDAEPTAVVSRLAGGPRAREILETFRGRLMGRLEEMEACIEAQQLEELVGLAHWLKGAAGTVGFDAFTVPAERLRQAASDRKVESLELLFGRIRDLADRIQIPEDGEA